MGPLGSCGARLRNSHPGAGWCPHTLCSVCRCPGAGPGRVVGREEGGEKGQQVLMGHLETVLPSFEIPWTTKGRRVGLDQRPENPRPEEDLPVGSREWQPLLMEGRVFGSEEFWVGRWCASSQLVGGMKLSSHRHQRGEGLGHSVWYRGPVTPVSSLPQTRPSQRKGPFSAPSGPPMVQEMEEMNTFKEELVKPGLFFLP